MLHLPSVRLYSVPWRAMGLYSFQNEIIMVCCFCYWRPPLSAIFQTLLHLQLKIRTRSLCPNPLRGWIPSGPATPCSAWWSSHHTHPCLPPCWYCTHIRPCFDEEWTRSLITAWVHIFPICNADITPSNISSWYAYILYLFKVLDVSYARFFHHPAHLCRECVTSGSISL